MELFLDGWFVLTVCVVDGTRFSLGRWANRVEHKTLTNSCHRRFENEVVPKFQRINCFSQSNRNFGQYISHTNLGIVGCLIDYTSPPDGFFFLYIWYHRNIFNYLARIPSYPHDIPTIHHYSTPWLVLSPHGQHLCRARLLRSCRWCGSCIATRWGPEDVGPVEKTVVSL